MKCPNCKFTCSALRDICPKCAFDLRPFKKALGEKISFPEMSYEDLCARTFKDQPIPTGENLDFTPQVNSPSENPAAKFLSFLRGKKDETQPDSPAAENDLQDVIEPAPLPADVRPPAPPPVNRTFIDQTQVMSWETFNAQGGMEQFSGVLSASTDDLLPAEPPPPSPEPKNPPTESPALDELNFDDLDEVTPFSDEVVEEVVIRELDHDFPSDLPAKPPVQQEAPPTVAPIVTRSEEVVPEESNVESKEHAPADDGAPNIDHFEEEEKAPQFTKKEGAPIADLPPIPAAPPPIELPKQMDPLPASLKPERPAAPVLHPHRRIVPEVPKYSNGTHVEVKPPAPPAPALPLPPKAAPSPAAGYQNGAGLHEMKAVAYHADPALKGLFSEALLTISNSDEPIDVDLAAWGFRTFDQDEDIKVLFEMASESIVNPDYEKRITDDIKVTEKKTVTADVLEHQLQRTVKKLAAPVFGIKKGLGTGKKRPPEEIIAQRTELLLPKNRYRFLSFVLDLVAVAGISCFFIFYFSVFSGSLVPNKIMSGDVIGTADLIPFFGISTFSVIMCFLMYYFVSLLMFGNTLGGAVFGFEFRLENGNDLAMRNALLWSCILPLSLISFGYLPLLWGRRSMPEALACMIVCAKEKESVYQRRAARRRAAIEKRRKKQDSAALAKRRESAALTMKKKKK